MRTTLLTRARAAASLTALAGLTALITGCTTGNGSAPPAATSTASSASSSSTTATSAPAGNGVAALPVNELFAHTRAALAAASTVHVAADVGAGADRTVITASVRGNQGATGTVKLGAATMGFLRLGNTVYLHADEANWRTFGADPDGAALLAGKYVIMPDNGKDLGPLVEFTSMRGLAAFFTTPPGTPRVAVDWPKATVRGQQAIRIGDLTEGAIFVATVGPPYPLRLQSTNPKDRSLIDLSDYNRPVTLTKPPASQTLTLPNT